MATHNVRRAERADSLAQNELVSERKARAVLFERFSYAPELGTELPGLEMLARFADQVRGVTAGVSDVLAVLERDSIDEETEDEYGNPLPRLVSVTTAGNLMRLAVVALDLLEERAERVLKCAGEQPQ